MAAHSASTRTDVADIITGHVSVWEEEAVAAAAAAAAEEQQQHEGLASSAQHDRAE